MVRLDTDWLLYPALVSNKEALMTQEEWEEIDNIYNSHLNK